VSYRLITVDIISKAAGVFSLASLGMRGLTHLLTCQMVRELTHLLTPHSTRVMF